MHTSGRALKTRSGMTCRPGDLVLIPFPYKELAA
jgi:hypothetical protein